MSDLTLKEQKIISQAWHQFLIDTTKYDSDHGKPNGWCWFWCLYDLYNNSDELPNLDLATIQSKLHNEHWLKINNDKIKNTGDIINGYKGLQDLNFLSSGHILLNNLGKANLPISPNIDFSGITFKDDTNFSNLIFPVDTDFSNTTFSKDVFFNNAIFFETADFEKATFQKKESYRKETAKFRNTVFEKIANFRNATFWGYANFKGSKLKGRAFFQEAKFKCHAPRFYDAEFNNEITWAGIELPNFDTALVDEYKKVGKEFKSLKCTECTNRVKCLKPVKCEVFIEENRRRRIEENQNAYENTSILLEKHRKYHDEHFFFREEMRCRRWLGSPFNKTIHFLYEKTADYGYGVGRALFYWALHIACGAYFIAWITSFFKASIYGKNVSCAISVSFANANPYIFFGSSGKKLIGCYEYFEGIMPINIAIINVVQNVIGVALLFLVLLTLRIRFRLK